VRLLLDTHAVLFALAQPERLSSRLHELLVDSTVERWVSVIALSEIAVKVQKGKLEMPLDAEYYEVNFQALSVRVLPVELKHSFALFSLPMLHGDPFDRLLIAQAKVEGLTIATRDSAFAAYGIPTLW
jgi:PIN domain nuclease of toxin-antitoxin system